MYDILMMAALILFIAGFIFPDYPVTAIFWIAAIASIMIGSLCSGKTKAMVIIPFVLCMILGSFFLIGD